MGNNQSQNQPLNAIQKFPRKLANKLPGQSPRDRQKDSGYHSGSASSSATVTKGARANDQTSATVASAGSEQGVAPRSESAPDNVQKALDTPAPVTRSAETVGPQ